MIKPDAGPLRVVRASGLGLVAVLLAAAAHVVGGGALPSPTRLLTAAALSGVITGWVAARRCGAGLIVAVLGLLQAALHSVFAAASATASTAPIVAVHLSPAAADATLRDHAAPVASMTAPMASMTAPMVSTAAHGPAMAMGGHLTPGMLAAHALATIVTGLLLARGERAVWALATWWAATCPRIVTCPALRVPCLPRLPRSVRSETSPPRHPAEPLTGGLTWRGPPVWVGRPA